MRPRFYPQPNPPQLDAAVNRQIHENREFFQMLPNLNRVMPPNTRPMNPPQLIPANVYREGQPNPRPLNPPQPMPANQYREVQQGVFRPMNPLPMNPPEPIPANQNHIVPPNPRPQPPPPDPGIVAAVNRRINEAMDHVVFF